MGTYTTNYNLFLPSIGEQGWGELVNGNFTTIDTAMKGLSNRATALENADTAFGTRITTIEEVVSNGNVTANIITANQFVGDISGTATGVNRVVNVSPSDIQFQNGYSGNFTIPYISGIKYTGSINGNITATSRNSGRVMFCVLKNGVWTNTLKNDSGELTFSFENVDMIIIYQSGLNTINGDGYVYLPLFT